jgi:predicted dehydrogenase
MTADLTVAIAGVGSAGMLHARCWALMSGIRIAAIQDTDEIAVAKTATNMPGVAAFTDVAALLASGPFDIVDVCSPPDERVNAAATALRSGAHVLCAWPPAGSRDDATALESLATDRERLLMPALMHRFHPPIVFARDLVENDDLGRIDLFRCMITVSASDPETCDIAIHGVDLYRHLVGEVAFAQIRAGNADHVTALLETSGGSQGVIQVIRGIPAGRTVVEVYGTAGTCIVDYDDGTLRYRTADQPLWQVREEGGLSDLERMIAHFADCVRGLQQPIVSAADGVRAMEILGYRM